MMIDRDNFKINEDSLKLRASSVPWDSQVFKFRVASISDFRVGNMKDASELFKCFNDWVDNNSFEMVSCRLAYPSMNESMILEKNGYFFIELVLHPILSNLKDYSTFSSNARVQLVERANLPSIVSMAGRSFSHERYHVDPRVSSTLADLRYSNWISQSFDSEFQSLYKVELYGEIIAFFIVEYLRNRLAYWHLTSVNPDFLGQGRGYMAWNAMIEYHKQTGIDEIRTTISAGNLPVLNLYSKLNFRFSPPEMTFHWKR